MRPLIAVLVVLLGASPAVAEPPIDHSEQTDFSHAWKPRHGAASFRAGDYRVHVGDAEKSIHECERMYEGSSRAPSCLSGVTVQHEPPPDAGPP